MKCPLKLYFTGTVDSVDYLKPCENICCSEYTQCKYFSCGFLVEVAALGCTGNHTVSILTSDGLNFPLIGENGKLIKNSDLTSGLVYRVFPQKNDFILKGVVQGS